MVGYFPDERHYDYGTGTEVAVRGGVTPLQAPREVIPVHIVGGNILPTQQSARNTELARKNPMGLIVALNDAGTASGSLFYDDGDSIGMQ